MTEKGKYAGVRFQKGKVVEGGRYAMGILRSETITSSVIFFENATFPLFQEKVNRDDHRSSPTGAVQIFNNSVGATCGRPSLMA